MRISEFFDPYQLALRLGNAKSPWLSRLFGARPALANFGDPIHDEIFAEVDRWRADWLKSSDDEGLSILVSCALAAGRCKDELLRRQMGIGYLRFERLFFVGVICCTSIVVAARTFSAVVRRREQIRPSTKVACFSSNRTVRATAARLFEESELRCLPEFGYYLSWDAFCFFFSTIARFPSLLANPRLTSNYFRLLSHYSHVIKYHQPNIIIGHFDSSSSVSLITAYLRRLGISHYNLMHGEVFYSSDHSTYAVMDRFYVWGQYYKDILIRNRCPGEQFHLLPSPALVELFSSCRHRHQPRDRCLLLLHEPYVELNEAAYRGMLHLLAALDETWTVSVRFHPAYRGNIHEFIAGLKRRLPPAARLREFRVENPFHVSPPETLVRRRVVASCGSTMSLEGWLAGCKCIYFSGFIRDEVFQERYQSSGNVLILSPETPVEVLRHFIESPAILDAEETARVNYVVKVCP
jgi:hypothetical protein